MKAFLDSSVLISAFLTPHGGANAILRAKLENRFDAYISVGVLEEVARSLQKKRPLRERYLYTDAEIVAYVQDLVATTTVVTKLGPIAPVCRDPADDHILAAARAAKANVIVTGDDDLLSLGCHEGIRIVTIRAFLNSL